MKWVWIILLVLVGVVALIAVVGWLSPIKHAAARRLRLAQTPQVVFAAITDVDAFPQWRKDLKSVANLPDRDGKRTYREDTSFGPIELVVESAEPGRKLVTRIADPKLPFGGTWTFRIDTTVDGCTLTITENGEVYNVFFRALSRFVFGYTSTMEGYLNALATKFGATGAVLEEGTPDPEPAPIKG